MKLITSYYSFPKLTIIVLCLLLNFYAIGSEKFDQFFQADLPDKALNIEYNKNGKIKELLVSSWIDRIKTIEGNVYRKYE